MRCLLGGNDSQASPRSPCDRLILSTTKNTVGCAGILSLHEKFLDYILWSARSVDCHSARVLVSSLCSTILNSYLILVVIDVVALTQREMVMLEF